LRRFGEADPQAGPRDALRSAALDAQLLRPAVGGDEYCAPVSACTRAHADELILNKPLRS
jgi:hypothetical protein